MNEERELTFGEKTVSLNFNPSGDEKISIIKQAYASIIDNLNSIRETIINFDERSESDKKEKIRLLSIAITEAQGACMWSVRSIVE